jgi:hypothetical protein
MVLHSHRSDNCMKALDVFLGLKNLSLSLSLPWPFSLFLSLLLCCTHIQFLEEG